MENIKHIIESLLFVAEEPLTVDKIKRITEQAEPNEIKDALAALSAEYDARPGGFYLDEVAGGFQIRTRPEYNGWIRKLIQPRPLRLSKAALETLVIIAYKQPIIRSDVEHLRGVDCGGVLRVLLERKLIRVLGRREIAGRPLIYATTKRFLEVFDLKNLKDLPTPKEIEELGASLTESNEPIALESTAEIESELESSDDTDSAMESAENDKEKEANPANSEAAGIMPDDHHAPEVSLETDGFGAVEEAQVIRIPSSPSSEAESAQESLMPNGAGQPLEEPAAKPKEENT
ncbi:MAG: SMC-Scp complex subunit ScpB [bacterium]|nr:SMC-Scp complex subunit ScpB [bacterium]